jgi:tetratricopeptide (TPR) repeat protein
VSLTTNEMFIAENWQRLYQQAMRHLQAGRILEAIGAHEKLLKARPDLADSWYNLAYLQHRARRFHEALASYRRAFGLGIDCPGRRT